MQENASNPKRLAIIQAATAMFLAHGYRNVSMDKIAQAAPVSKATLYNHFDSKTALFTAVVCELCNSLLQTMNHTLSTDDDVATTLKKIAHSFLELLYSPEGLGIYRLVIAETHEFPELGQMVYDNSAKLALNQLEAYLQHLNNSGCFYIHEPRFAADAFFSLLEGDLHFRCLLGIQKPPTAAEKAELAETAVAFYLRGIIYAL